VWRRCRAAESEAWLEGSLQVGDDRVNLGWNSEGEKKSRW
jgi:hypothetical protein